MIKLDDLNHDLTLLDTMSDKECLALNEEANSHPEVPLGGPIRYLLNARANLINASKSTEPETTEDNLTPLEKARAAAAARS